MNNKFYYELRKDSIELQDEQQNLQNLEEKFSELNLKNYDLTIFKLNKERLDNYRTFATQCSIINLGAFAIFSHIFDITTAIGIQALTITMAPILLLTVPYALRAHKKLKKVKLEIAEQPEFQTLTKKEIEEMLKELDTELEIANNLLNQKYETVEQKTQDLQEKILNGPVLGTVEIINKETSDPLLEEFLQEPIDYKSIHLKDIGEIECNKKLTKVYNK